MIVTGVIPSHDGKSVLYAVQRGGPVQKRELLQLSVEGSGAEKLVASGTEIPSFSAAAPGGRALAFVKDKLVYELRLDDKGEWERKQLLKSDSRHDAATGIDSIVYSPDATKIAFVSRRKAGQSYIVIHDIMSGETRYIDPGIFLDATPVWSPDGMEIAFVRQPWNLTMQYRFTPQREAAPWSIVAANATTGAARTVWKADRGPGSLAVDFLPVWTPDGQILFLWEKTGWRLLYSVPARGGAATTLTPGEGEVSEFVLSPDGRTVICTANFGDLSRTHLWSVALAGGRPVQLTSGGGIEIGPRFSAGGYLSYLSENRPEGPPQIVIRSPKGKQQTLARLPTDLMKRNQAMWSRFLPAKTVSVRADDGVTSHHVVIEPQTKPSAGTHPVIVNAHGGPVTQTFPGRGYAYAFGQYAARHGYLFIDINYRGSAGFGLDYRLPDGRGATGGSEVKDLAALLRYLKGRGDADMKRIGIMGASYGGHIVGLAMTQLANEFAAGVSLFGVADWVVEMKKDKEDSGDMRDPLHYIRLSQRTQIEDLAFASSPTARIENWRAPTLFTIGDLDSQGHMESVIDLGYRLLDRGVPVEFYVDPAGGHNVFPQERVFDFFEAHLKSTVK
jgi:dipeptidyl aminopeptidase/acylaminoacyl peptidase